eukprot:scaffold87013_cov65-Phaeocystis_antarctica.AAC.3
MTSREKHGGWRALKSEVPLSRVIFALYLSPLAMWAKGTTYQVEQPVVLPVLVIKQIAQQGFPAAPPLCSSSRPQSDVFAHGFRRGSGSRVSNAPVPMNTSAGDLFPPSNTSDNTDYPIPKDRYNEPITYDGNPAALAAHRQLQGSLREPCRAPVQWCSSHRPTRQHPVHREAPASRCTVQLLQAVTVHAPTVQRIALYNMKALAASPRFPTTTPRPTRPFQKSRAGPTSLPGTRSRSSSARSCAAWPTSSTTATPRPPSSISATATASSSSSSGGQRGRQGQAFRPGTRHNAARRGVLARHPRRADVLLSQPDPQGFPQGRADLPSGGPQERDRDGGIHQHENAHRPLHSQRV